jgi:ATP-dependent Lon protease
VPFDLSKVIFICTANVMDTVPPALRDRMEIIEVPGYTQQDKLAIAKRFLVSRQLKEHGLTEKQCKLPTRTLEVIIDKYTREAGVRSLNRTIAAVIRGVAAKIAEALPPPAPAEPAVAEPEAADAGSGNGNGKGKANGQSKANGKGKASGGGRSATKFSAGSWQAMLADSADHPDWPIVVEPEDLPKYLGPARFESELAQRTATPGVVTGLAYTAVGGEILFVEATQMPGKGNLQLTGQIGDVMRESAQAAYSLLKSNARALDIDPDTFSKIDIHVHVPAGAVPKDGPSAGVAMYTALVSLLTHRTVRPDVAMTGEITLRGLVLPIGGVKEKVVAAQRAGIKTVILPERNRKDVMDIRPEIQKLLTFEFAGKVEDVLAIAFAGKSKAKSGGAAASGSGHKKP